LSAGVTIPPVPPNLAEKKFESGQFVEKGDLVPTHLETTGSKTKQRSVANIFEWLQAFAVYVAIKAKKQPQT